MVCRKWELLVIDSISVIISVGIALVLRFGTLAIESYVKQMWLIIPVLMVARSGSLYLFGLYSTERQSRLKELLSAVGTIVLSSAIAASLTFGFALPLGIITWFPRSLIVIELSVAIALIGGARLGMRVRKPRALAKTLLYTYLSVIMAFLLTSATTENDNLGLYGDLVLVQNVRETPAGEIYGSIKIGQTLVSPGENLYKIEVLMGTYARQNDRDVLFHVRRSPTSDDLITIRFNASEIEDNSFREFSFDPIHDSGGQSFYFFIESPDSEPGNAITVWGTVKNVYEDGAPYSNHERARGELAFRAYAKGSLLERVPLSMGGHALQILMFGLYFALTFCVIQFFRYERA